MKSAPPVLDRAALDRVGARHFRYVSKDGTYKTRWRVVPDDGLPAPTPHQRERLGEGYSVIIRKLPPGEVGPRHA